MTAPRYKTANNKEVDTIRARAPRIPDAATNKDISWMIKADAHPASIDATTYFQTTASTGVTPKRIGFPAYQNAGIKRIQKEALQAEAIPAGPHGNARKKSRTVTANSRTTHRSQRSALPIERWIKPLVK